jgi:hypothetical protein
VTPDSSAANFLIDLNIGCSAPKHIGGEPGFHAANRAESRTARPG